jgi:ketosteroid isomerase-like protein
VSCGPEKPKSLSDEQIKKEKESIQNVIDRYNTAYSEKSLYKIVELLAKEPVFFGTDSAETIKTMGDFQTELTKQWSLYKEEKFGTMSDVSIQMDDHASFASIIYGMPCEQITLAGDTNHYYFRYARILKKEKDKWVIVSGIAGATTKGQSNSDLLQKATAGQTQEKK